MSVTLLSVDVSSNNANQRNLATLNTWIGLGAQLLIVHSYHGGEQAGLADMTREWIDLARLAGIWRVPYTWLFRSYSASAAVRESVGVFRDHGDDPKLITLDCETYGDPVTDRGPTVDQILEAQDQAWALGLNAVLYTGNWWLDSWLEGDGSRLAGMPALICAPGSADLSGVVPLFGLDVIGRQYQISPTDWSVWDAARLLELGQGYQSQPDPCQQLRASLQAIVDRKPYRAPSKKALAAMLAT